jgi:hypothetical protein
VPNEYGAILSRQGGVGLNAATSQDNTGETQVSPPDSRGHHIGRSWGRANGFKSCRLKLCCESGLRGKHTLAMEMSTLLFSYVANSLNSRCLSVSRYPGKGDNRNSNLKQLLFWSIQLFRSVYSTGAIDKGVKLCNWVVMPTARASIGGDLSPDCVLLGFLPEYFVSLPANKLELWMALESGRFIAPVFRQLYSEKEVRVENKQMGF